MDELRIIQYLDGEMSGKELENFEKEVSKNPDLEEEVARYREIQELAMKLLSDRKDKGRVYNQAVNVPEYPEGEPGPEVEKEIVEVVDELKKNPESYGDIPEDYREILMDAERELHRERDGTGSMLMIRRIWYSAAALVILAIVISVLVLKPFATLSSTEIYAQYFKSFSPSDQNIEITRDDNDFLFATEVYEAGDFERASVLFDMLSENRSLRAWSLFYTGCSYMSLNQTGIAIEYLLAALNEQDYEVIPHVHWQLALCYLKQGKPEKGIDHLKLLSNDKGYKKDAKRLRRLLNQ